MSVAITPITEQFDAFRYLGDPDYFSRYRNLIFTPAGFARLWHTVGYCQSAYDCGNEDDKNLATKLLEDLHSRLAYLNEYGGTNERFKAPNYRVAISDDGCWGSFGLVWFSLVEPKTYYDWLDNPANKDKDFNVELRCDDNMKLWTSEGYVRYRRCFIGGLICHKDSKNILNSSYGIHT